MAPYPAPGGVLALDLGGTLGWAYGHIRQNQPLYGRLKLRVRGEDEDDRFVRLSNAAYDLFTQYRPARLLIEAALPFAALNNQASAYQQYGMRAIARCEARRAGLPRPQEYSADLVRHEVLGRARFPKGEAKKHVLRWARQSGFKLSDEEHDIADALALWEYYCARLRLGLFGTDPALLTHD